MDHLPKDFIALLHVYISQDLKFYVKPALARRDVDMQLLSLLMNASFSITAS
jgi:hypothetical protein